MAEIPPGDDRISKLPNDVIDEILKRLPLREAVRTSILSRGWRHKWASIPDLVLDEEFENSLHEKWNREFIFDRLLVHHEGPIVKFSITGNYMVSPPAIDRWLQSLLNHRIEYLCLGASYSSTEKVYPLLPIHLFSFDHLIDLCLCRGKVRLPPTFEGFTKLVKLELFCVSIELEELKRILCRCPMLVSFNWLSWEDTAHWFLHSEAPNLKCFNFVGNFSSIYFGNAKLEEIAIGYNDLGSLKRRVLPASFGIECDLVKVFGQLSSVRKVRLDGGFLEFLAIGGVPQKLTSSFNDLTILCIDGIDLGSIDEVSCALCLIGSSPNLQSLDVLFEDHHDDSAIQYLKSQQMCNVPLNHLKNVRIYSMSGSESKLQFVRLLLLWATELEKLEMIYSFELLNDDELDEEDDEYTSLSIQAMLLKEIASFPRASTKAILIFY